MTDTQQSRRMPITARPTRFVIIAFAMLITTLFASPKAFALEVPEMRGPVNDLAGILSESERSAIGDYLTAVNDQTGVQVAVLTIPSLEGQAIEDYSMRVAEKWKLGSAEKDNGALLVVSTEDRAIRIEVGYGLEQSLTDAKCGLIIRSVIAPRFREGAYGEGIAAAVKNVVGIATDDATIVSESVRNPQKGNAESGSGGIAFIIFVAFILLMSLGGIRRHGFGGFLFGMLLGSFLSSGRHDRWGGSGGFGGGGGFSGGGGGFGGGGSSGGW